MLNSCPIYQSCEDYVFLDFRMFLSDLICALWSLGEYDAVIICVGAKADMLPELSGKLPLRTCRGVIAHMQLPDFIG